MSNSTQTASFFQSFFQGMEGSFTNWTQWIDVKATRAQAAKLAYKSGIPGVSQVVGCIADRETYFFEMGKDIAYRIPKIATEWACWGSRWIYWLSPIKPPAFVSDAFSTLANQIQEYSHQTTSWMTGKTIEAVKQDYLNSDVDFTMKAGPFTAFDFLRSTLILGFFARKALYNLFDALDHGSLLLTGTRLDSTAYKTRAATSYMKEGTEGFVTKTRVYSTIGLFKDTAIETAFAGLWGTGAYYSYYGIRDAVEAATQSADRASLITNVILATSIAGPILLQWIGEAISDTSKDEKKSPKNAQHLVFTDGPNLNPGVSHTPIVPAENKTAKLNIKKSSEELNFSDAVKILEELRGPHTGSLGPAAHKHGLK